MGLLLKWTVMVASLMFPSDRALGQSRTTSLETLAKMPAIPFDGWFCPASDIL